MFPRQKCKFGKLSEMDICLGDYAGNPLTTFAVNEGEKPCLGKYLQTNGLHISRCTFYLMTKESVVSLHNEVTSTMNKDKPQNTSSHASIGTEKKTKIPRNDGLIPIDFSGVVCSKQDISIKYVQEQRSKYSDEISYIHCNSINQCRDFTSFYEEIDEKSYNPCQYGFLPSRIKIGNKTYVEILHESVDGVERKEILYPSSGDNQEGLIIHEPSEIWGYDDNKLVFGIVCGSSDKACYQWFKDNAPVDNGDASIYIVKEPGIYTCEVTYIGIKQLSKPIQVISVVEETTELRDTVRRTKRGFSSQDKPDVSKRTKDSTSSLDGILLERNETQTYSAPELKVEDLNIDFTVRLGSGSFGTVYKGHWAGSDVAVKALQLTKRNCKPMVEMIEKEIHISSKIRHPNIVLFLAIAKSSTTVYLVHEYIDGCNMEDAIFDEETKHSMQITQESKTFICQQVVQGVAYLHALVPPVIHQDIKPGNVLIKKGCFTTKLCDLGVSRIKSATASLTTQTGKGYGTPAYMALECLLHNENSTALTDIWSLGVTLIEFVFEEDFWRTENELDTVDSIKRKMRNKSILTSDVRVRDFPETVMNMLKKCIDFNRNHRPRAEEILQNF